jgi:hypothetical protein
VIGRSVKVTVDINEACLFPPGASCLSGHSLDGPQAPVN